MIRAGKLDEADRQLRTEIQKNPADVHALVMLGNLRERQHLYIDAEKFYVRAAQADPKARQPVESLAKLYSAEDRTEDAIPLYESLLKSSPSNLKFEAELAQLYQKQREFQKSLDLIEKIPVASRPDRLLVVIVADYIGLKRSADLQKGVDNVLHHAPADPSLIPQLATVLLDHGMRVDANDLLELAAKHQAPTAAYLAVLARLQATSGQLDQAQASIDKALALDPKSQPALIAAGYLAQLKHDWKAAMAYFQRAEKAGPPSPALLDSLVLACMRANDLQAAHDAALDLLDIQPDSPEAALVMCAVLIRGGHWGEADRLLDKVLTALPGDKRALAAKGVVDYNVGRIDDAQKHLTASLGEPQAEAQAHYYLGLVAKQKGDYAMAANYMEQSLKADPENVDAMTSLGQVYLAMGQAEKARPVLEKAAERKPQDPQVHYQLALAYKKSGMEDKARSEMAMFQQLSVREGAKQPVGKVMSAPK